MLEYVYVKKTTLMQPAIVTATKHQCSNIGTQHARDQIIMYMPHVNVIDGRTGAGTVSGGEMECKKGPSPMSTP